MSEMVERVARAICVKNCEDPDEASYGFLGTGDPKSFAWRGYIPHAIAALAALREPTEEMVRAAYDQTMNGIGSMPRAYWQAMIDEALKP